MIVLKINAEAMERIRFSGDTESGILCIPDDVFVDLVGSRTDLDDDTMEFWEKLRTTPTWSIDELQRAHREQH